MVEKGVIKRIILDSRRDIVNYKIINRHVPIDNFSCYIFVGVRRAGKSYLMYQEILKRLGSGSTWDDLLYFNFEDDRLSGFDIGDIDKILECHIELGGSDKPMFFFDEIQNVEGWEKYARRLADAKNRVWITGSNARMLSSEMMSTLGGRYLSIEVYPFSFEEYLDALDVSHDEATMLSTVGKAEVERHFAEYFCWGGLPESISLSAKRDYLSSTYQKIYLGDICIRDNVQNPAILRLMIKKISESVKQPISYSRIAKVLSTVGGKISMPTVANYISYCEDAWLLLRLRNITSSLADKETNCKYYFIDNGLLSLLLIDTNTTLLENVVALDLFRRYGHDADNERLFFYNDRVEIDFYVPDAKMAIQVAYSIDESIDTSRREIEALTKFAKLYPCDKRVIVTYYTRRTIEDEYGTIEVVPCAEWLLRL